MGVSYKLPERITELSVADEWEDARLEWALHDVYILPDGSEFETCLCGHYPIKEVCTIRNTCNATKTKVGNCCVKKFFKFESARIFAALSRVAQDFSKAMNIETLNYARRSGWINDWEYLFSKDTMKKRKITAKQRGVRIEINKKILRHFVRS